MHSSPATAASATVTDLSIAVLPFERARPRPKWCGVDESRSSPDRSAVGMVAGVRSDMSPVGAELAPTWHRLGHWLVGLGPPFELLTWVNADVAAPCVYDMWVSNE